MQSLRHVLVLVSFPVLAAMLGAIIATVRAPGPRFVSGVQHFAAGVVMAALIGEIMPELRAEGQLWSSIAGFVLGAALVLALGAYGRKSEAAQQKPATGQALKVVARAIPIGMLGALGIDLLLDGVLVGLGARLGATQGLILTAALTIEILFLGLSMVGELREAGFSQRATILTTCGLGLLTGVGAVAATILLGSASASMMAAVLAFGAAALLYLVVEELLVEAHEEQETMLLGAMFFLGFLVIYVLSAVG